MLDKQAYIKLIKDCIASLREENQRESSEEYIYMESEFDSSQTKFERMSNMGEIAVRAKSDRIGFTLLLFLRMIIDNHLDLARYIVDDYSHTYILANAITLFQEYVSDEEKKHPIDEPIEITLESWGKTTNITVQPSSIDLWDLERVEKALMDKLLNY